MRIQAALLTIGASTRDDGGHTPMIIPDAGLTLPQYPDTFRSLVYVRVALSANDDLVHTVSNSIHPTTDPNDCLFETQSEITFIARPANIPPELEHRAGVLLPIECRFDAPGVYVLATTIGAGEPIRQPFVLH